jgi:hypothetical protein
MKNNTQQKAPNTLGVSIMLAERVKGNKELCKEIASDLTLKLGN